MKPPANESPAPVGSVSATTGYAGVRQALVARMEQGPAPHPS
jgi:hypothetical protein